MGVNITEIINSARQVEFRDLEGKSIAIDAHNTMYQFLSIIRDRFTGEPLRDSKGQVTSHLSGIFYRTSRMIEGGIEPIFVFDGRPPEFKKRTNDARHRVREEARKKWKDAVDKKDYEAVRRYSQQAVKLTPDMIVEAKKLLDAMGIPWVQAPSEGEAQAAKMVKEGLAWSTGGQDWDSLLFGAPRFVKNLAITGRRKVPRKEKYIEVVPELIELDAVLKELGISQEQLIVLGIMIGTDYNPGGIRGIGPKKALALVKEHPTLEASLGRVEWGFDISAQEIMDFFQNPPVTGVDNDDVRQGRLDGDQVKKIMCDVHEFSEERIEITLKKLSRSPAGPGQAKLGAFLGK